MLLELLLAITGSVLLALVLYIVETVVTTRRNMHAFKKKLGPSIPMASGARLIGGHLNTFAFGRSSPKLINKCHKEFGSNFAVMYGKKLVVFTTDLDLMRQIVLTEGQEHVNRLPMEMPMAEFMEDNIMLARDEQWRRIRRAFASALRASNFKTPNVEREVTNSIAKLKSAINKRIDAAQGLNGTIDGKGGGVELDIDDMAWRYALNLALTCIYKRPNAVDFDVPRDAKTELTSYAYKAAISNPMLPLSAALPMLRKILDWLIWNFHPHGVWRKDMMENVKQLASEGLQARKRLKQLKAAAAAAASVTADGDDGNHAQLADSGKKQQMSNHNQQVPLVDTENFLLEDGRKFSRSIVDHVIDQFHDGKLTPNEYCNSTMFLLNAADKSTSDSISQLIYQLAIHPEKQEKLRKSILEEGAQSQYLAWAINESLRILAPAPVGCGRIVKRDFPVEGGGVIPAGTMVIAHLGTVHFLPKYWGDDANEFKPERFAKADTFHPLQFMPFGAGIRGCPGKDFALHEMKQLFNVLMREFKFECEPRDNSDYAAPLLSFTIMHRANKVRVSRLSESERKQPLLEQSSSVA